MAILVVNGIEKGEGQVAGIRNKLYWHFDENLGKNLDFGQHNIYFGYYIGVLATEYYLLWLAGKIEDRNNTENELLNALNQWINYLDNCETLHYPPETNDDDGFFIRTDVDPINFFNPTLSSGQHHLSVLNKDLNVNHDVYSNLIYAFNESDP